MPEAQGLTSPTAPRLAALLLSLAGDGNNENLTSPLALADIPAEQWEELISLAGKHNITAYVGWKIHQRRLDACLPESIAQKFHRVSLHASSQHLWMFTHLERILKALQQANTQVILLKGAHLGSQIYPKPGLRSMADIDLLIREEQLSLCDEVIINSGYRTSRKPWIQGDYRHAHHHLPVYSQKNLPPLEVHWTIAPTDLPLNVKIDTLWEEAVPIKIGEALCQGLSPEHLLLHLSIHACYANRFRNGLRPLIDIREVLQKFEGQIDWQKLCTQANAWGASRPLHLTLALVADVFHLRLPIAVGEGIGEGLSIPAEILQISRQRLWENQGMSTNFARLWNVKGVIPRLKILMEHTFPNAGDLARRYGFSPGSPIKYLFYLRRGVELITRYTKTLFSMRRGKTGERAGAEREIALAEWLLSSPGDAAS